MISVMQIVRKTSLFFQPQIRTKILNEGWASYWHEKLFLKDDRIQGHEVGFARVNAKVTALPRVGLNPYALGMRLFSYIEELGDKGKLSYDFQKMTSIKERSNYDRKRGEGGDVIFKVRENLSDFMFINSFVDQEFVDRHQLFVTGKRLNSDKGVWEYYVKSRDSKRYKEMLLDSLYHPPAVIIDESKMKDNDLYLNHHFEGKPLIKEFIPNTLMGIEYLWGGPVRLETTELKEDRQESGQSHLPGFFPPFIKENKAPKKEPDYLRVVYTMNKGKITKSTL
jgi:stage V sporulation protein R